MPIVRKKYLKDAVNKGHVVQARLIKSRDINVDRGAMGYAASGQEIGLYQYNYKGKSYQYRMVSSGSLPDEVILYFNKKPGKAGLEDELGLRESPWLFFVIISLMSFVICSYFLA